MIGERGDDIDILHLEDEVQFADLTRAYLENANDRFTIEHVADPQDALERFTAFDCIVTDYDMPVMNGLEFLQEIRERDRHIPVILFTGKGSEEVASEAISYGVTDYVQKGGTERYDLLANRIEQAVAEYTTRQFRAATQQDPFTVLERITDAIITLDDQWRFTYINQAAEEIFGQSAEQLLGESIWETFPEAKDTAFYDHYHEAMAHGESMTFVEYFEPWDRWYREHLYPSEDSLSVVFHDITEEREHEQEIRQERDRLSALIDAIPEPMARCVYNEDDVPIMREINPAFEETFGITPEEAIGRSNNDLIVPDDQLEMAQTLDEQVLNGETVVKEVKRDAIDGERDFLLRAVPIENAVDGDRGEHFVTYVDITEQKERERELAATSDQLEALLETVPAGIFMKSADGAYLLMNDLTKEFAGLDPDADVTGKTDQELFDADLTDKFIESDQAVLDRRETVQHEQSIETDQGTRTFLTRKRPLLDDDGEPYAICAVSTEITRRKTHEQALNSLHSVASDLTNAETQQAIADRTVEAADQILEFDQCLVAVERDGLLEGLSLSQELPPDADTTMPVDEGIAGETFQTGESILMKDTADYPKAKQPDRFRSGISIPIGRFGVFQAVSTEVGTFDERDLELGELLVRHTHNALDRIEHERELERHNTRLDEFANIVSHDLRNPLSIAAGNLQLAKEEYEDDERLENAQQALERMSQLIGNTLTLARQGELVSTTESVDLATLAEQCWTMVETGDLALEIEDAPTIRADRSRLRQVFENLFNNAVSYGGETVRIGSLSDSGFFIEDDGPGIPSDQHDTVFEAGFTTHETGIGFGLAIVREIIEAHEWSIDITQSEAGGARFEIRNVMVET